MFAQGFDDNYVKKISLSDHKNLFTGIFINMINYDNKSQIFGLFCLFKDKKQPAKLCIYLTAFVRCLNRFLNRLRRDRPSKHYLVPILKCYLKPLRRDQLRTAIIETGDAILSNYRMY